MMKTTVKKKWAQRKCRHSRQNFNQSKFIDCTGRGSTNALGLVFLRFCLSVFGFLLLLFFYFVVRVSQSFSCCAPSHHRFVFIAFEKNVFSHQSIYKWNETYTNKRDWARHCVRSSIVARPRIHSVCGAPHQRWWFIRIPNSLTDCILCDRNLVQVEHSLVAVGIGRNNLIRWRWAQEEERERMSDGTGTATATARPSMK